jgi:hypothetical protein
MDLVVKEVNNTNYKKLLQLTAIFNIASIDIPYYKNILEFYENDKLVGLVNYCINPSMGSKDHLFIRNLYYNDSNILNNIVVSLCNYCKSKNLIIITTNDGDFTNECITAFYNNNFTGKNVIIYK